MYTEEVVSESAKISTLSQYSVNVDTSTSTMRAVTLSLRLKTVRNLRSGTSISIQRLLEIDKTTTLWKLAAMEMVRISNGEQPIPDGGNSGDLMEDIG
jgi:hypothetical protein